MKEILFKNKRNSNYRFDLVDLEDILKKKPKDHSQFDHHKISFYVIALITHKNGKHSINYNDYSFKKGTVFTLRKNNIHKFYKTDAKGKFLVFTEDFVIHYSDKSETIKLFQLFNEMLSSPKLQLNSNDFAEIENLIGQIAQEYSDLKNTYSIEIIRYLMQVLILKLFRIKSKSVHYLGIKKYHLKFMYLQELIERECFESKKVSYYANKMGVTSKTLNNITQAVIGKSAKSCIDEIVILQIKRLLINSSLSFTEIAYQAGFSTPTNFFKYFRKKTGLSPKQFKENSQ
ncbi:AraC family transcriptional regulator [Aquimarina sp. 2201CG14-23]|uniref:AraC family transcriptional regulator n=1 Tax=Aquimarina mycalae TaxID=3040073 RepID=UPI002477EA9F|nr:helix-turn-helix transcriptional regulator [Aquimarina sp. 2201CG14-23]MDH7447251.1 helix-turn-helix transcriptional regulator [Aquimarina sp. 2201CG14-23]